MIRVACGVKLICDSFKYTVGAQSNAGLDQVLYYDNLGWADERKTLAEDDGGNQNSDAYNEMLMNGHVDDEESAGTLVTIKGEFVSDAAEVSTIFIHLICFLSLSRGIQRFLIAVRIRIFFAVTECPQCARRSLNPPPTPCNFRELTTRNTESTLRTNQLIVF